MRQRRVFSIVIGCIFGLVFSIFEIVSFFALFDKAQIKIMSTPSTYEGVCLTDQVRNSKIKVPALAEYFKDACVSIILTNGSSVAWGSGVNLASTGFEFGNDLALEGGSYIMTNYHVMQPYIEDNSYHISVYPNKYDDEERYPEDSAPFAGELLWYDSYLDMAIVYTSQTLDWVRMKDRVVSEDTIYDAGDSFVIGSPYVEEKDPAGVIHATNPILCVDFNKATFGSLYFQYDGLYTVEDEAMTEISNVYEDLIVMDIEIHPGNSGGGLFDSHGYLIGQPTLSGSDNYTFANSIYPYTVVLPKIIEANEQDQKAKIFGLDALGFTVIDYYENTIIDEHFKELYGYQAELEWWTYRKKTYFGATFKSYPKRETGLKVLSEFYQPSEKFLEKISINEVEYNLTTISGEYAKRNDLLYLLLNCKKGDILTFTFSDLDGSSSKTITL